MTAADHADVNFSCFLGWCTYM